MLGALLIVLIRQSIRTLHFDQNYEWIIIGCAMIIAVVLDQASALHGSPAGAKLGAPERARSLATRSLRRVQPPRARFEKSPLACPTHRESCTHRRR